MVVVGGFFEGEFAGVVEEGDELGRTVFAEEFGSGGELKGFDFSVLFSFSFRVNVLPRQGPSQQINQRMRHPLQVVPPALLDSNVGVETGVARSASQALVGSVWNVLPSSGVFELLGQSVVDYVQEPLVLPLAQKKVVRLNVSVDKILGMEILYPLYLLRNY